MEKVRVLFLDRTSRSAAMPTSSQRPLVFNDHKTYTKPMKTWGHCGHDGEHNIRVRRSGRHRVDRLRRAHSRPYASHRADPRSLAL